MKEPITVLPATPEDINQCDHIDIAMGFSTTLTVQQQAVDQSRLLIARTAKIIVGYLRYSYLWDGELPYIQMIRVASEHRNKGVGRKLIETLEKRLQHEHIRCLLSSTDETNLPSLQFHQALGFEECGKLDINEDGIFEIFLKKMLPTPILS